MKIPLTSTLTKTKNTNSSFETTKDVDWILQNLMLANGYKILPEKTLIIFDEVKLCFRFSLDNLKLGDDVLNIPLVMTEQADRLIGLALEPRAA